MGRAQMIPIILNASFARIALIDDFISFIWTQRFYTVGDFELCCDIRYADILQVGGYIQRQNDDHAGMIEKVQYKRTEEAQEMVIVSGRMLAGILARRVITTQTQLTGLVRECIKVLINENIINPTKTTRKINNFTFTNNSSSSETMDVQYLGENLLETVASLCETYSIGMDCTLDSNNRFAFKLYDGTDRSYGQNTNPYVIFSDKYDNLLNAEYEEDYTTYSTDVLVGGEGDGINRTMVWASKSEKSGLARYEKFLDASSAVSNDEIITQETYEKQLEGLGLEEATNYTTAFTGEVDFTNVELNEDVFIGDIVTIENTNWGTPINTRLIEVIESIAEDGTYSAIPTFGI